MKFAGSHHKAQSQQGAKTHMAGISNHPPADEEQQQRQLPSRGQAKKDAPNRQRSRASVKGSA